MSARAASRLAWTTCGLALALTAFSLLLLYYNWLRPGTHLFDYRIEDTVIAVDCSIIGALISSRRPDNLIGWIFCGIGLLIGVDHLSAEYAIYSLQTAPGSLPDGEALAWVRSWIWIIYNGFFVFLGLFFPDGRLPGSRWRWFAWLTVALVLAGVILVALAPGPVDGLGTIQNPIGIGALGFVGERNAVILFNVVTFGLAIAAAVSLFVRLRHARGVEREQLKWFVYAAAMASVGAFSTYVVSPAVDVWWFSYALLMAGIVGLPVAVGAAILRYRLYDIDAIINRTIVYTILTASLALAYVVCIVTLQMLVNWLTGEPSQLVIVASTLGIAALFNPLRRRIQTFIDRRFYREKYDAARALAMFSARLRDEVALDPLSEDLLSVVRETMHPEHVSLWLRMPRSEDRNEDVDR